MTGAAVPRRARRRLRADAGYVTLAVPRESLPVVETLALEPVKRGSAGRERRRDDRGAAERAGALALGPGLGRSDGRARSCATLLERVDLPAVVDADALFGLEPVERGAPTVLTPHAGELARLLDDGLRRGSTRTGSRRRARRPSGSARVVLLKGADTIVAAPGAAPSSATSARRRSRRRAPATCSPASSPPSSPRGSSRRPPPRPPRSRTASRPRSSPHQAGLVASDVVANAAGRARAREGRDPRVGRRGAHSHAGLPLAASASRRADGRCRHARTGPSDASSTARTSSSTRREEIKAPARPRRDPRDRRVLLLPLAPRPHAGPPRLGDEQRRLPRLAARGEAHDDDRRLPPASRWRRGYPPRLGHWEHLDVHAERGFGELDDAARTARSSRSAASRGPFRLAGGATCTHSMLRGDGTRACSSRRTS